MPKRFLLLSALFIFILTGCAISPKRNLNAMSSALEPQALSKFADIPVPVGVKIVSTDSYAFESAGVRVGVLTYRGKVDADRATSFYREQMPMYNWNILNVVEYGNRMLNFDRETETCIIGMQQVGKLLTITITLGPKSQTVKRTTRPVK